MLRLRVSGIHGVFRGSSSGHLGHRPRNFFGKCPLSPPDDGHRLYLRCDGGLHRYAGMISVATVPS